MRSRIIIRSVRVEELSVAKFLTFGFYANHIDLQTKKKGAVPIEFFRDMVQLDLGGSSLASFSTCRVKKRNLVIDVSEYHSAKWRGIAASRQ